MTNYLHKMLYALTSAYTRKDLNSKQPTTNIGKLFAIFAWGLDTVHEQAELIRLWDDIDNARGTVLDRYGANWGVKRFSKNDALYRLAIRIKILSQLSGGDTDTVIKAAAELLGVEYNDLQYEDVYPAKIAIRLDWDKLTQERQELIEPIAQAIKRIIAAGVGMKLYVNVYRSYHYDLKINWGLSIDPHFVVQPIIRGREVKCSYGIGFHSLEQTSLSTSPAIQNVSQRNEIPLGFGGLEAGTISSLPIVQDVSQRNDIRIGSDAYNCATLFVPRQRNSFSCVHIKPKRIK